MVKNTFVCCENKICLKIIVWHIGEYHQSAKTLIPLTGEVKNINLMCFWETLDPNIQVDTTLTNNPTQTVLQTKVHPLMTTALPNGSVATLWLRHGSDLSRHGHRTSGGVWHQGVGRL